jgi:hypothetical protein
MDLPDPLPNPVPDVRVHLSAGSFSCACPVERDSLRAEPMSERLRRRSRRN